MTYKLLKVGSDAELFVTKNDMPFPICGLVGGTKESPLPVLGGNGFAVQEDNVMLEFNIPPAQSAAEFSANIGIMLDYLRKEMETKGLKVHAASSLLFEPEHLRSEQAQTFGCEPDFCVWSQSVNRPPEPGNLQIYDHNRSSPHFIGEMRSSGYHIHVSYEVDGDEPDLLAREALVKAQDLFLGVPSVLLDESPTQGHSRKGMYGRAGCFRPKPYGHEYRVLGGQLLKAPLEVHSWLFDQTQCAIDFLNDKKDALAHLNNSSREIQSAINRHDSELAIRLMGMFKVQCPPLSVLTAQGISVRIS